MELYKISNEFKALESMLEDGEIDQDAFEATVAGTMLAFEDKAANCLMMAAKLEGHSKSIGAQIARLKAMQDGVDSNVEKLKEYVKENMLKVGRDKMTLSLFQVSIRAATKQLPKEIDESKISSEFFTVIPESKQLDRRALLAAIKINPIDGIELVDSKRSLTIK